MNLSFIIFNQKNNFLYKNFLFKISNMKFSKMQQLINANTIFPTFSNFEMGSGVDSEMIIEVLAENSAISKLKNDESVFIAEGRELTKNDF